MRLNTYAEIHGIKYRAAWNRYRAGKISGAYLDDFGHVIVPDPITQKLPIAAIYARVSTHAQKDDLDRQAQRLVEYAIARGYQVLVITKEIASGVNDQRPKLTRLLQNPNWGTLVIEHRDRLSRVGYNWFETLLGLQGRKIDVANAAVEETVDLMSDFMAIVYSFAARMYGLRSAKRRTNAVQKAIATPIADDA